MVETESQKIRGLETKVIGMEKKLDEITEILKNTSSNKSVKPVNQMSVWHNKEKLESIKAPPSQPVLVIKSGNDSNHNESTRDHVEKTIMENKIAVTQLYKKKDGDIVVVCETEDIRIELKSLVATKDERIVMNTPAEKCASITIVGLQKEYEKEEIIDMLILQNGFINGFTKSNDIRKHIEIHAVQPLKNNPEQFQVFANVSTTLCEGFMYYHNKVTLGLTNCKIYDRFHVKRCNNCQKFGHYMKECLTPLFSLCLWKMCFVSSLHQGLHKFRKNMHKLCKKWQY